MIFQTQDAIDKILRGEKTQSRRLRKSTEQVVCDEQGNVIGVKVNGRWKWRVGQTRAIQPGRGKPSVARIRITDIRREDARDISWQDALAEGYANEVDFWMVWTSMHDKEYVRGLTEENRYASFVESVWVMGLKQRPAERYQCWALTFELVREGAP